MKKVDITFLGTCARDFSPRLEGDLKDKFDKDARRSSSMMIDGCMLVDCGRHTLESLRIAGKDTRQISDIFITHLHDDHYDAGNIAAIASGDRTPLRLWAREGANIPQIDGVELLYMKPFEKYCVREGMHIVGMPANHDPNAYPQHFVIEIDGKKIFYGCDGGWMLNETYNALRGALVDFWVFDATVGDYEGDFRAAEHNSIPMIKLLLPSLRTIGAIGESTVIYLSHIAPSLHLSHEQTVKIAEAFGAHVAYDGLQTTV